MFARSLEAAGVGEDAMIHTRIRTPHEQRALLWSLSRFVVVVVDNDDRAGDVVEFMVLGYVVKFVLGRETWWVYGRVRFGVGVRILEEEKYPSLGVLLLSVS